MVGAGSNRHRNHDRHRTSTRVAETRNRSAARKRRQEPGIPPAAFDRDGFQTSRSWSCRLSSDVHEPRPTTGLAGRRPRSVGGAAGAVSSTGRTTASSARAEQAGIGGVGCAASGRSGCREVGQAAGSESARAGGGGGGMRGGVADRRFGGFWRAIPRGGRLVGRVGGWRPPPEPVGKCAQIHGTGLARELLDGRAPVRVRIAPARCLTGWTRDGWDCPGGPASAGSPWVSGGFFSDL